MIQLMENVYFDLALQETADHPDNAGWMNLFEHWAQSAAIRKTWHMSHDTFSKRFQHFCAHRLHLAG